MTAPPPRPRTGPHYLNLGPTATYRRRRAGWFPGGDDRLGMLRLVLDHARRSTDTTEVDEYAVQEETDLGLSLTVRSFLLENLTDPDPFGPFRCVVGGMVAWCGCEAGWFDTRRIQPTGCKHRDALGRLVAEGIMDRDARAKRIAEEHGALLLAIDAAVELRILELTRAGGPDEDDFARVRANARIVASASDVMMFGSKGEPGKAAEVFAVVADALAVMAFVPGGVKFAGRHWASGPHNRKAVG